MINNTLYLSRPGQANQPSPCELSTHQPGNARPPHVSPARYRPARARPAHARPACLSQATDRPQPAPNPCLPALALPSPPNPSLAQPGYPHAQAWWGRGGRVGSLKLSLRGWDIDSVFASYNLFEQLLIVKHIFFLEKPGIHMLWWTHNIANIFEMPTSTNSSKLAFLKSEHF